MLARTDSQIGVPKLAPRRMPKAQRRAQMLNAALEIIAAEGSDALTLTRIAISCGVTKPIAYQHFGSRSGLLIALYREIRAVPSAFATDRIERAAAGEFAFEPILDDLAESLIDMILRQGRVYAAIEAALLATPQMENYRDSLRAEFAERFEAAIAPFFRGSKLDRLRLIYVFFGAGEALCGMVRTGLLTREGAIETLSGVALDLYRRHRA